MGSMMTKQEIANYTLHFGKLAADIAFEQKGTKLFVLSSRYAGDLIEQAGYIQALAQEADTLDRLDQGAVDDFDANWRMAVNWWDQTSIGFMQAQDAHTVRRIQIEMEGYSLDHA